MFRTEVWVKELLGAMVTVLLVRVLCFPRIACASVHGFVTAADFSGNFATAVISSSKTEHCASFSRGGPGGVMSDIPVFFIACKMGIIVGRLPLGVRMHESPVLEQER